MVTAPGGTGTLTNGFTYADPPPPTITELQPTFGPVAGGIELIIFGTGFTGAAFVTFGSTVATSLAVVSDTQITVTTPAHAAGPVDVAMNTTGGTALGGYTYVSAPTITSLSPTSGLATGGTVVTLTGTDFTGATAVTFGGTPATAFTVDSATEITATAPAHAEGAVDVAVTTDGGTATLAGGYTYLTAAPIIAGVSPTSGPATGGTAVIFTGINFTGTTTVAFGATAAVFTVLSDEVIEATAPPHSSGSVDLTVTTSNGTATLDDFFFYNSAATGLSLVSSSNPSEVGESVTFTATMSSDGTPTGTVTFYDGETELGTDTLSGGQASFTISSLGMGSHSITASYSGDESFEESTSPALVQNVATPEDSVNLRAIQLMATQVVGQNSGAALTGAISGAISDGFAGDGTDFQLAEDGVHLAFSAGTARAGETAPPQGGGAALPGLSAYAEDAAANSRIDRAFGMANGGGGSTPANAVSQPWRLWADVSVSGIPDDDDDELSSLEGTQVNAVTGATYRFEPNFLAGILIGYETFDYDSETLNGELDGDGLTVGSYLGWKLSPSLRFNAAAAYSAMSYSASSGAANGDFDADRWLLSGGLTSSFKAGAFEMEPSSNVYVLWEDQDAYVDSLGTDQSARSTFAGRASAGFKVSYPTRAMDVVLTPFTGLYADYYANDDDDLIAPAPGFDSANVPFDDGFSGRFTFGVGALLPDGTSLSLDGELGGLGQDVQASSGRARLSKSF